jgi:hypothetical protein
MARRIVRLLPALVGVLALTAFIPFIQSQSAGFSVKTWLDPFTPGRARDFLAHVFYPLPMAIVLGVWTVNRLWKSNSPALPPDGKSRDFRNLAPLVALAAVPIAIVVFSALVQSALRSRYAIAASLCVAPVAALTTVSLPRSWLLITALMLTALGFSQMRGEANLRASMGRDLADRVARYRSENPPLPIIFVDRGEAFNLLGTAPDLAARVSIADQRQPGIPLRGFRIYESEMIEKLARFYPAPPRVTLTQIRAMGRFHLIAPVEDLAVFLQELPLRHVSDTIYEPILFR